MQISHSVNLIFFDKKGKNQLKRAYKHFCEIEDVFFKCYRFQQDFLMQYFKMLIEIHRWKHS